MLQQRCAVLLWYCCKLLCCMDPYTSRVYPLIPQRDILHGAFWSRRPERSRFSFLALQPMFIHLPFKFRSPNRIILSRWPGDLYASIFGASRSAPVAPATPPPPPPPPHHQPPPTTVVVSTIDSYENRGRVSLSRLSPLNPCHLRLICRQLHSSLTRKSAFLLCFFSSLSLFLSRRHRGSQ